MIYAAARISPDFRLSRIHLPKTLISDGSMRMSPSGEEIVSPHCFIASRSLLRAAVKLISMFNQYAQQRMNHALQTLNNPDPPTNSLCCASDLARKETSWPASLSLAP